MKKSYCEYVNKKEVASLSQKYEKIYSMVSERHSKDIAFYNINNAIILLVLFKNLGNLYTLDYINENFDSLLLSNEYNTFLLDSDCNFKREEMLFAINELYDTITALSTNGSVEKVLGLVLERHINQKETGAYYTPSDTTQYITNNSILICILNNVDFTICTKILTHFSLVKPIELLNLDLSFNFFVEKVSNILNNSEKQLFVDTLYNLKLIDPTCGSGAFITTILDCIANICSAFQIECDCYKILNCIYGVDIETEAIHLTKFRIWLKFINHNLNYVKFNTIINSHFVVANAVRGSDYIITENGFDWKTFGCQFDCIVGNPPYIEKKKYVSDNFKTQKCTNLYANVIERACNIAKSNAIISFIVPLPFVSTPRMLTAKNYLEENSSDVYYTTFADRPCCIFTGVHQKLAIFFAQISNKEVSCSTFSSSHNFWYNNERENLFKNIYFISNNYNGILPKIGNEMERNIYRKLTKNNNSFGEFFDKDGKYELFFSTRIGFWAKAFSENVFTSKEFSVLKTKKKEEKTIAIAILNSSIFYFYWVVISDCWHVTNNNINSLMFDCEKIKFIDIKKLEMLVQKLMKDLEKNKEFVGTKQTQYEYKHKFSKNIIDEIDDTIGKLFNLTQDEIEYVKHYTEQYRLNKKGDDI
jgi:hypothetical protein